MILNLLKSVTLGHVHIFLPVKIALRSSVCGTEVAHEEKSFLGAVQLGLSSLGEERRLQLHTLMHFSQTYSNSSTRHESSRSPGLNVFLKHLPLKHRLILSLAVVMCRF